MPTTFSLLVERFLSIIGAGVTFVFALTVLVFVWGILKAWVLSAGDEKAIDDGKKLMVASVVALVVMSGIWGILNLLRTGIFG